MIIAIYCLAGLLVAGVIALILVTFFGNARQRLFIKMVDSTIFVVIGILAIIMNPNKLEYSIPILIGAAFSFLGDFFLGINYKKEKTAKNHTFIYGGVSFFFAQVAYASAFISNIGYHMYLVAIPFVLCLVILLLSRLSMFNLKNQSPALVFLVAGYAFFVAFTFTASLNYVITLSFANRLSLISLGGLFFIVSDYLLLHKYFFHRQFKLVNVIYMSTYYLAQLIYVTSIIGVM